MGYEGNMPATNKRDASCVYIKQKEFFHTRQMLLVRVAFVFFGINLAGRFAYMEIL